MNERIQELAMQAFIADSVERNPRYKRSENTNIIMKDLAGFNKKFAELLINECTDIVNKRKDAAIEASWNVDEAMSNAVWDIEAHFYGEGE